MKAATAFALALFVPNGIAFVLSSGNAGRRYVGNLDDRHVSRVASSKQHAAEAHALPDSQTLSEVSFKEFVECQQCVRWSFNPHVRAGRQLTYYYSRHGSECSLRPLT